MITLDNAAQAKTAAAVIKSTLLLCAAMASEPQYREYAANIRRKAAALKRVYTAESALRVLEDLKVIAQLCGTWEN
jgi:hypothetical protein